MSHHDCAADIRAQDGIRRCGECITLTHRLCTGCDQWHPDATACGNCVSCAACAEPTPAEDVVVTIDDDFVCELCSRRSYWRCDSCDAWNPDDQSTCGNGCDDESDLIHAYEYKPYPEFHGAGPLFLGLELEIHAPWHGGSAECAQLAVSHLGELGYLKNDSSVDDGFEIVTHPMGYAWALANFPWTMLTELAGQGCATSEDTGLHVHVSRAGFDSPCHSFRWMKFLYRNRTAVVRLARRSSEQWAAFTDEDRRAVKHYVKGAHSARYRAINTGNDDTFELRVFASSLKVGDVQAALGLAAASIEYTRHLTVPQIVAGGWDWSAFAGWVRSRPEYAPLREQMEVLVCAC